MFKALATLTLCALALPAAPANINIPIEKYKLDNGLRVILSQDNTLPVVAVYIVYDVGARSEERGRTGFAHLFEHMMFEGSANVKKGEHMRYVESNGGSFNGSTHPDYTNYFETMPSNKLAVALWLESDRMRSLAITPENLTNQKEAVKQERRLSFDNQPYATAIVDKWPQLAFQNWQSSHSLIGSFEDLNAATIEDVSKFFKTYYAPNNAVLTIVGDIQIGEAKKLVQTYFADIPSQPQPKRPDLAEPTSNSRAKSEVYKDVLAKVPGVVIGYAGPPRGSDDFYAMVILDALLTGGDSSRLQQDLVKGKKSVVQYQGDLGWPFAAADDYKSPGEYATFLVYKPNFQSNQIVDQYQDEVARIQKEGVTAEELHRAQTLLLSSKLNQLQTSLGRATLLANFEVLDGAPEEINSLLGKYEAVTAAQVQSVAKKYLSPNQRVVLAIQPDANAKPNAATNPQGGR
ncbi:MAG: insulinase family protein [Acidobacteriaceae bacterium]|nr:insulinase family protein [Acidobacteriaceae bacterium]MBV9295182.1 insulinase family protein [Acidobacteriaceae bacterium]MBV9766319.1 insulinase family protein [Acidobacteriaceae bacterium]